MSDPRKEKSSTSATRLYTPFSFLKCSSSPHSLISILPSHISVLLIYLFHSVPQSSLSPCSTFVFIHFRRFQFSFFLFPHLPSLRSFSIPIPPSSIPPFLHSFYIFLIYSTFLYWRVWFFVSPLTLTWKELHFIRISAIAPTIFRIFIIFLCPSRRIRTHAYVTGEKIVPQVINSSVIHPLLSREHRWACTMKTKWHLTSSAEVESFAIFSYS